MTTRDAISNAQLTSLPNGVFVEAQNTSGDEEVDWRVAYGPVFPSSRSEKKAKY